jgi:hypothetical protein
MRRRGDQDLLEPQEGATAPSSRELEELAPPEEPKDQQPERPHVELVRECLWCCTSCYRWCSGTPCDSCRRCAGALSGLLLCGLTLPRPRGAPAAVRSFLRSWLLRASGFVVCALGAFLVLWAAQSGLLGSTLRSIVLDTVHFFAGHFRPAWDSRGYAAEEAGWTRIPFLGAAAGCAEYGWESLPSHREGAGRLRTRQVIDGFLFNGEFDLLRMRMAEYSENIAGDGALSRLHGEGSRVHLIAVESARTFTKQPKRLYLSEAIRSAVEHGTGPLAGWVNEHSVKVYFPGKGGVPPGTGSTFWGNDVADVGESAWASEGRERPPPLPRGTDSDWLRLPILHVVIASIPQDAELFQAEGLHRSEMRRVGETIALPGDLMLAGDVDELPSRDALALLRTCAFDGLDKPWNSAVVSSKTLAQTPALVRSGQLVERREPVQALQLDLASFLYSFEHPRGSVRHGAVTVWDGSGSEPLAGRWWSHSRRSPLLLVGAGWHCSWCFRLVAQVRDKAMAYSHADRAHKASHLDPKAIQERMCAGEDPFGQVAEAYTWGDWVDMHLASCSRRQSNYHLPALLVLQPMSMPWLLPGRCLREDRIL